MKYIACQEPNLLVMNTVEKPIPSKHEALVRIRRIGICGTDLHAYKGIQPFFTYPRILGHELAGEIEEIAHNTQGFQVGDQVTIIPYMECGICIACRNGKTNCCTQIQVLGVHKDGGMREWINVPITHLIPTKELSLDQSTVIEPFSIGAHAVRRAGILDGEYALIIGAGPIGLGVMKFAKLTGAKVIAMDVNNERLEYCKEWVPADYVVNALNNPLKQLEEITQGDLPTVVFDATGNAGSMTNAFQYAAHGGKLIYVGLFKGDITFHDPDFHKKELTLMGSRNATREDFEYVIRSIKSGEINVDAFITHRSSFDDMIGNFESWLNPQNGVIKAVVEV